MPISSLSGQFKHSVVDAGLCSCATGKKHHAGKEYFFTHIAGYRDAVTNTDAPTQTSHSRLEKCLSFWHWGFQIHITSASGATNTRVSSAARGINCSGGGGSE